MVSEERILRVFRVTVFRMTSYLQHTLAQVGRVWGWSSLGILNARSGGARIVAGKAGIL
jgi:hypothetical protein